MCGRFTLATPAAQIAELFGLEHTPELTPRYNIAPSQQVAIVRRAGGRPELAWARWGLVPSWARDPAMGARTINARCETVAVKPAFRAALRRRRCLIPADGFYEWRREGNRKQPFYFSLPNGSLFAFAGLWERWEGAGEPLESCTILTTGANDAVAPVHDRMPVILAPEAHGPWLDPSVPGEEALAVVLAPLPSLTLRCYPVSSLVNNPANDTPDARRPLR